MQRQSIAANGVLRYSCVIKLIASARSWKNREAGSPWIPSLPHYGLWMQRVRDRPWLPATAAFLKDAKAVKVQRAGNGGGSQGTGDSRAEDILARKRLNKGARRGRRTSFWWRSLETSYARGLETNCETSLETREIYGQKVGEEWTVKLLLL